MAFQLPSIDNVTACGAWPAEAVDQYQKLPFYLVKAALVRRKEFTTWPKLLNTVTWTPNQGDTMRRVGVEDSPVLRQLAFPNLLAEEPKVDLIHLNERTTDAKLRRHRFMSPRFNFLPAFQDFMEGNIVPAEKNINKQMMVFAEQFALAHIWNWSPYVYVAGLGFVEAPSGEGNAAGTAGKMNTWLQADILPNVTSRLTFEKLYEAMSIFVNEIGATPYEGDETPSGDSRPLSEKYCLVTDNQTWLNFVNDPWLKENRPLDMNIVTGPFQGEFFGRIKSKITKYGVIRIAADNNWLPSYPAPETVEQNSASPEYHRTRPNPTYARAPFTVSFLVGGKSYSMINPGPPPGMFAGGGVPSNFNKLTWNGEIILNKNFLIPCEDGDGVMTLDTNNWGEWLRFQSQGVYGIVGDNKFNVLPIIHQAPGGITTITS